MKLKRLLLTLMNIPGYCNYLIKRKVKDFKLPFITFIEPKLKMMIQLMYHSGLRISNIINLKVGNVDFNEGW